MMLRSILAAAAERERDSREAGYPKLIEAGRIAQDDAEADLRAWRTIAEIFANGFTMRDMSWSELHLASSRALQGCDRDVERTAGDEAKLRKRLERRDLVFSIHQQIELHKFRFEETTAILRGRADVAESHVAQEGAR